jgi:large repetitive protein
MINAQRINADGVQTINLAAGQRIRLADGESLLLNQDGVQTFRFGSDLVLLVPIADVGADGQTALQRVTVTDFFNQGSLTQVVVQAGDGPVLLVTPQSKVTTTALQGPQAEQLRLDLQAHTTTPNASVLDDLRIDDARLQLFGRDGAFARAVVDEQAAGDGGAQPDLLMDVVEPAQDIAVFSGIPNRSLPSVPVLTAPSSDLRHPDFLELPAFNRMMVESGETVFSGQASAGSEITLTLTDSQGGAVTFREIVSSSGQWRIVLGVSGLSRLTSGVLTAQAFATSAQGDKSDTSVSEQVFVDVVAPAQPQLVLPQTIATSSKGATVNAAGVQNGSVFTGKAEPRGQVDVRVTDSDGFVIDIKGVEVNDQGQWQWPLTAPDARALASGLITLQATATDLLGNRSDVSEELSVWLDIDVPAVPSLELPVELSLNAQNQPVFNREALLSRSLLSGTSEVDAQVNVRFVDASGKVVEYVAPTLSDGSWSLALSSAQAQSLQEGTIAVSVQAVDAAGNASGYGVQQDFYLDTTAPEAPLVTLPLAQNIQVDGLGVFNRSTLATPFTGVAEPSSTVEVTLIDDAGTRVRLAGVVANANGQWSVLATEAQWQTLAQGEITVSAVAVDTAGNASTASAAQTLYMDIAAPLVNSIVLPTQTVTADVNGVSVQAINRDAALNAARFTGRGEVGSTVVLTMTDRLGASATASGTVDADGQWSMAFVGSSLLGLADGVVSISATARDLASNTGPALTLPSPLELHTTQPSLPTGVGLAPASDTGNGLQPQTNVDTITRNQRPSITGQAQSGLRVRLVQDTNGNGLVDAGEAITYTTSNAGFTLQPPSALGDGAYSYIVQTEDIWGNHSPEVVVTFTIDTLLTQPLTLGPVAGDDKISYQEIGVSGTSITLGGEAEAGAVVALQLFQNGALLRSYTVIADASSVWTLPNFASGVSLVDGTIRLSYQQTDVAGNQGPLQTRDIPVRVTPLPPVRDLRLASASDTFNSNEDTKGDGITSVRTPTITGTGTPNTQVRLLDAVGDALGVVQVDGSGAFQYTLPSGFLVEGVRTAIQAQTFDPATGTVSQSLVQTSVTLDTQVAPVVIDPVAGDDVINDAEYAVGVEISGSLEAGAVLSLTLSSGGTINTPQNIIYAPDPADASIINWRAAFTNATANALGDGIITLTASQVDKAGNVSTTATRNFVLNRSPLRAPGVLDLDTAYDTGVSQLDNNTQGLEVPGNPALREIKLNGIALPGVSVRVFDDINGDGLLDAGEELAVVQADALTGAFTLNAQLGEGVHTLRASAFNAQGQSSSSNTPLLVTVDTVINDPANIVVASDNRISAQEAQVGEVGVSGDGDANATVHIDWVSANDRSAVLVTTSGITVGSDGKWTSRLNAADLAMLPQGEVIARVQQTDRAGNVSNVIEQAVTLDSTAPGVPSLSERGIAAALNFNGPWADGITWGDLYADTNGDGVAEPRVLPVAVALPAPMDATAVQAGDTVTLNWGGVLVRQLVTADDLVNGYVSVDITGDEIRQAGVRSGLAVTAAYTDRAGNVGESFDVLTGISVPLTAQPPVLVLADAAQNPGNLADLQWYSNNGFTNANPAQRNFRFEGSTDIGATVTIYVNGPGVTDLVLARVTADATTGAYRITVPMPAALVDGVVYSVQAVSTDVAGLESVRSDAQLLVLDTVPPAAPVITQTELNFAQDALVNSVERSAGVPLSGTAEPFATIVIRMLNKTTGVAGSERTVRVGADGSWSRDLTVVDWGQVGDGEIEVSVHQADLSGNVSAAVLRTVIYDSIVGLPTLDAVAGNDFINAAELGTVGTDGLTVSGGGEPLGQIFISLRGANGLLQGSPFTLDTSAEGRWFLSLTTEQLTSLGQGQVAVDISQQDKAGNRSSTVNRSFTIDSLVAAPGLNDVATDNTINPSEKSNGVQLSGDGEIGATVTVTLSQTQGAATVSKVFTTSVGVSSAWAYSVSSADLDGYNDGAISVQVTQRDLAGNTSAPTQRTITLATQALGTVTLDPVSTDNIVALSEQSADLLLTGTGPASSTAVSVSLQLELTGVLGVVSATASIDSSGRWSYSLTPDAMRQLGQGQLVARLWATNANQQSSEVVRVDGLVLENAVPVPLLGSTGSDDVVNAAEAAAGVDIGGTGVIGNRVLVTLTGSSGLQISGSATVGSDGEWKLAPLTSAQIQSLVVAGTGVVEVSLQQAVSGAANANTSVVTTKSFAVDTVAPTLPGLSDTARTVAAGYNATNSDAKDRQISIAEAQDGVVIGVPMHRVSNAYVLRAGDKVTLNWGDQTVERTLSQADFDGLNGAFLLLMTVPADVIAAQGSGSIAVSVVYTDAAGNASAPLTLISALSVSAPPSAPTFNTVSGDGFVNSAEFDQIVAQPLVVEGNAPGAGSVTLTLSNATGSAVRVFSNLQVDASNAWSVQLSSSDLLGLGEGTLSMSAVFTRQSDGAPSAAATSTFTFDRTSLEAPSAQSVQAAAEANAISELAGGLIRPRPNVSDSDFSDPALITEAASNVQVRVALPANVATGDIASLLWGQEDNVITATVTQAAINQGHLIVNVPATFISAVGDAELLKVSAFYTDKAGNQGETFEVWEGRVDAVPVAPVLFAPETGEWLNISEAAAGWELSGTREAGAQVEVTLAGALGTVHKTVAAGDANWALMLTDADARAIGTGAVNITAIQRDSNGNPSASATTRLKIDLVPPAAPDLDAVRDLTYAQTQNGVTYTGVAESVAPVTVVFQRGDNTVRKEVNADSLGAWRAQLSAIDFAALSSNGAVGPVSITAVQRDPAGNESQVSTPVFFNYSSTFIAPPVINVVTGLAVGAADNTLNAQDLDAASGQVTVSGRLTVSGTGPANQTVRLVFNVEGAETVFEVNVDATGAWTRTLTEQETRDIGQGVASLTASAREYNGPTLVNESASTALSFTRVVDGTAVRLFTFLIDTQEPTVNQVLFKGTGSTGNAKEGERIEVVVSTTEPISIDTSAGLPTLEIGGFAGTTTTRTATLNLEASRLLGNNQMVFVYEVQPNDAAGAGQLSVLDLSNALALNNATVVDLAGNPADLQLLAPVAHQVIVDTTPPNAPAIIDVPATVASTIGGTVINGLEAQDGVSINIDLDGTGATAGDTVEVTWRNQLVTQTLSDLDISNARVAVLVSAGVINQFEGQANVSAKLIDVANNVSALSAVVSVAVDTIAPRALALNTWMGDGAISAAEVGSLQSLTGTGVERTAGTKVFASITKGAATFELNAADISIANGVWTLSQAALQSRVSSLADGDFSISVWQEDAAGNVSAVSTAEYYKDVSVPSAPGAIAIPLALDGWVNRSDANQLVIQASIAGSGAQVGDTLRLSGLRGQDLLYVLTSTDLANGLVTFTPNPQDLLQPDGAAPERGIRLTAFIEDQGGNLSPPSVVYTLNLDTNIATPTVDTKTGLGAGVTPSQAKSPQTFTGAGIEAGAVVDIVFTGFSGKALRVVPTVNANGTFTATLNPSDFVVLGEGVTSYQVFQTDPAGNISETTGGAFNIALSISAPVLGDFAVDNIVGTSEVGFAQTLSGSSDSGNLIETKVFVGLVEVLSLTPVVVAADGQWSVPLTPADFAMLQAAAGGDPTFTARFEVRASAQGSESDVSTQNFLVSTSVPTAQSISRFDGDGDGANNDGLEITFSEAVRVQDLGGLLTSFNIMSTVPGAKTFGTGARIEAVDSVTVNGAQFAQTFRIYLGEGSNLAAGDAIGAVASRVVNIASNTAATNVDFTVPTLSVPLGVTPPLNISANLDNLVNQSEKVGLTNLVFTHAAAQTGDELLLYVDGVEQSRRTMVASATSTTVSLSGAEWGVDGGHSITAQVVRALPDGTLTTSVFSVPKVVEVDSRIAAGVHTLVVINDAGVAGLLDAGDKLLITFNEPVGPSGTVLGLPSAFGVGATATAVGGFSGTSLTWEVTLGTSPSASLSGQSVTISGLRDNAGNTGSVTATVPTDILDTPSTIFIDNVTRDNVIDAAERAQDQTVTVSLTGAKAGDVVELLMDGGTVLGSITIASDGQTSASFDVAQGLWGGDGQRVLNASIQRGSGTALASNNRFVYVSADSTHWSATGNVVWFDPDTLLPNTVVGGAKGASTNYISSVGTELSDGSALRAYQPAAARDAVTVPLNNGHTAILLDYRFGDFLWFDTPTARPVGNGAYYASTSSFALPGPTGFARVLSLGSQNDPSNRVVVHGQLYDSIDANGGSRAQVNNALTQNVWNQLGLTWTGQLGVNGLSANGVVLDSPWNILGAGDGSFNLPSTSRWQGQIGSNGRGRTWNGLIGDTILVTGIIGQAYRQEIDTYTSQKFQSAGQTVAAKGVSVAYDLSLSSTNSTLLDEVLDLTVTAQGVGTDTVITAGTDYVNAGSGDDTIIVKDLQFRSLDGGLGRDTLALHADYVGSSIFALADFVSNARGVSADALANERVNVAGYHKLLGLEAINLATNAQRQVMTVAAADVNQLSETNVLEVTLGVNDVLLTQGFGVAQQGIFKYQDEWYDHRYSATASGQALTLFSTGGDQQASVGSFKLGAGGSFLQLNFDHAMSSSASVNLGQFDIRGLGAYEVPAISGVASQINQRQGVQLSFDNALSGPVKITYNGSLVDEAGRGFSSNVWLIGTDVSNVDGGVGDQPLNASVLSAAEQARGVVILGGGLNDQLTGGSGNDTLLGGFGSDTLTGGAGSDTFRYVNERAGAGADAGLGGIGGDVITDFNLGKTSALNADRLDLSDFFKFDANARPTGDTDGDLSLLLGGQFLDVRQVINDGKADLQFWVDRDGGGTFGQLTTLQNITDAIGGDTGITGVESTSELLRKLLDEGRLIVS